MVCSTKRVISFLVLCVLPLVFSFSVSTFSGISVFKADDPSLTNENAKLDFENYLKSKKGKSFVVLGTYAADFNAIEYAQRLRYYLPALKEKGISNYVMVLNASPNAAKSLAELVGLPKEVEVLSDCEGSLGKAFGCSRGWRPEDLTNPYAKLFGMLWGLGAWATLPSVIGGYLGNPFTAQPWIEDAMLYNQINGRWPDNALEVESTTKSLLKNKFTELPVVGEWKRRPLELATLRLQNMLGISLKHWDRLKPTEKELSDGMLTQLGGCFVLREDKTVGYEWRDAGICHVANFEDILRAA